ncbi:MAG: MFS transporter [Gammaproteobacteria bacterium]|nr:MFS transporter [Gammaproteobacteria bacterium]
MERTQPASKGQFVAFIAVAFINAFVDLGHKIVIQNTLFHTTDGQTQVILTSIVNAMILLPFIVLFTPSAWLADRFAKAKVMRRAALAAVGITSGITLSYAMGWFWTAYALTFALAAQSALYSPAKYGAIRELAGSEKLARANGWVQGATTISILLSTLLFSLWFEARKPADVESAAEILPALVPLGLMLVAGSILEYLFARSLPDITPEKPRLWNTKNYLMGVELKGSLKSVWGKQVIWLTIIGLGVFWALSQVLLVVFPAHAKSALSMSNTFEIQALMATSAIGIALGSVIAGQSRRHIELGLVPIASVLIAGCVALMPILKSPITIAANFFVLGFAGGLYLVPMNALMQFNAPKGESGRVIASNNLINNWIMVSFLGVNIALSALGLSATQQLYVLFAVAVLGALYTIVKLPQSLIRLCISAAVGLRYRVQVGGLDRLPAEGGVLMLGNHISFLDWAFLQIASPRPIRFIMDAGYYRNPFFRPIVKAFGAIPLEKGDYKEALLQAKKCLQNGEVVCIFPEGAVTATGHLLTFKRGFEQVLSGSNAIALPFYLNGLWGSQFTRTSRLRAIGAKRRDVYVQFGQPMVQSATAQIAKQAVTRCSVESWQTRSAESTTLGELLIKSLKSGHPQAIIDPTSGAIAARKLLAGAIAFAKTIRSENPGDTVGVLLPPGTGSSLINIASWLCGKTVVNLNYSASAATVLACAEAANVRRIYTADTFLQKLEGKGFDSNLLSRNIECIDTPMVRQTISKATLLAAMLSSYLPTSLILKQCGNQAKPSDTATLLFSSGSEGLPKGIELSHQALISNAEQVISVLQPDRKENIFAALPHFHAFGLTVGLIMPLIEGFPITAYQDPTDVAGMAKSIEKNRATLIILTGTLYHLMARHPKIKAKQLESLRLCIAGAEKLQDTVRSAFEEKFGKQILEGYGATEMSPVVSVNLPDRTLSGTSHTHLGNKLGTVGMPIPGTSIMIVDPDTYRSLPANEAGMVLLSGPQMMTGYLDNPEKTDNAVITLEGQKWYITGDKGMLDEDGYLSIIDRYARFAKIGGEMISLTSVEQKLKQLVGNPEINLALTSITDESRGEKLVVISDHPLDTSGLRKQWLASGHAALQWPVDFRVVERVPMLGSGKLDFQALKQIANEVS